MKDLTDVLNNQDILDLVKKEKLLENYIDLDTQITPNGFDLTVASIFEFIEAGAMDFSNKERVVPAGREIPPIKKSADDKFGWWELKPGAYKVKTNEIVNIPCDLIALAYPRSTLLRIGGFTQNAVWDAGFKGKSEFILIVNNPYGIKIKQNARVIQLIFVRVKHTGKGYDGIYQNHK